MKLLLFIFFYFWEYISFIYSVFYFSPSLIFFFLLSFLFTSFLYQETDLESAAADMPSATLMDFSAPEELIAVGPHQTLSPMKENM